MPVLTGVDLLRIQQYVFGSNRLRDVAAASLAVELATDRGAGLHLPDEKIVLAAGGNAVLVFEGLEEARHWTAGFTRRLEDTLAPDLEAAVVHREFAPGGLAQAWLELQDDLAGEKLARRPSAPQLGLSVTAACALTGRPAVDVDEEGTVLGRRYAILREHVGSLRDRWKNFLPSRLDEAPGWRAEFPLQLDELGRTRGETSLVGVVHVDGNGVGHLIQHWLQRKRGARDDDVKREAGEWSGDLCLLSKAVFRALVARIAARVAVNAKENVPELTGEPEELKFPLAVQPARTVYLPLRPIVLGGDDLTFVCDGRIALDLAAAALRSFEQQPVRHLGTEGSDIHLTACAGVAIVRSHTPFYRAYEAAKMLCASAKKARREVDGDEASKGSWLDWMIGFDGPLETIEDARQAYRTDHGELSMRPYPVTVPSRAGTWGWLEEEVLGPGPPGRREEGFRGHPNWVRSRNRVKQLAGLARSGGQEVKRQLAMWRASQRDLRLPGGLDDTGFVGGKTPLLDAIELMDVHLRLAQLRTGREQGR
ncbi:MAG: hypothetical protein RMK57_08585 [Bryobacterales bacterium]|nr:hypothetical protein [Bryobacteraceae bacterium]MDW8354571.1 hypothetical protein [Bryobacterales bacterium]